MVLSGYSASSAYSLWPASWLLAIDKGGRSKSVEVRNVWEVYDDRLQFISWQDTQRLSESLDADDVSCAWLVWSSAEAALADAFRFGGGPVPSRGLILGRGSAFSGLFSLVGLWLEVRGAMLLMLLMVVMCSCIGTLPLLPHWS